MFIFGGVAQEGRVYNEDLVIEALLLDIILHFKANHVTDLTFSGSSFVPVHKVVRVNCHICLLLDYTTQQYFHHQQHQAIIDQGDKTNFQLFFSLGGIFDKFPTSFGETPFVNMLHAAIKKQAEEGFLGDCSRLAPLPGLAPLHDLPDHLNSSQFTVKTSTHSWLSPHPQYTSLLLLR